MAVSHVCNLAIRFRLIHMTDPCHTSHRATRRSSEYGIVSSEDKKAKEGKEEKGGREIE